MRKITGFAVMVVLVLYLVSAAQAGLGVFVGSFDWDLEKTNRFLDGTVNRELETNLEFKSDGLIYSFTAEGWLFIRGWSKRLDIFVCSAKTGDTIIYPPDESCIRTELDLELGMTIMPIFLTWTYHTLSKGDLSFHLGAGPGTVLTFVRVSRKETTIYPGGVVAENPEGKSFIVPTLAGQVLIGVGYRFGRGKSVLLEAGYIASSRTEIRDQKANPMPIEAGVKWNGSFVRAGLMIGF